MQTRQALLLAVVAVVVAGCGTKNRGATLDGEPVEITETKSGGHTDVVVKLGGKVVVRGSMIKRDPIGVWTKTRPDGTELASGDYTGWTLHGAASFLPDGLRCVDDAGNAKPAVITAEVCEKWAPQQQLTQPMRCERKHESKTPGCSAFPAQLFYSGDELGKMDAQQQNDRLLHGIDAP